MENWLIQLAEFVRGTLKGVFPALENALRGLLTFLYPAYADSFDIPGLATELTVLLLAAAFAVLVKLICLLFARKSRTPFVLGVLAVFLLFLIPSVTVTKTMIRSEKDYRAAENLLNRGRYAEAIGTFRELGEYRGAGERAAQIEEDRYAEAEELLAADNLEDARGIFAQLGGYRDAEASVAAIDRELQNRADWDEAERLLQAGQYPEAVAAFRNLGDYRNAEGRAAQIEEERYAEAKKLLDADSLADARDIFAQLGGYRDAEAKVTAIGQELQNRADWEKAEKLFEADRLEEALALYTALGSWGEAEKRAREASDRLWAKAQLAAAGKELDAGHFAEALAILEPVGDDFPGVKEKKAEAQVLLSQQVRSWDEVYARACAASQNREPEIRMSYPDEFDLRADTDTMNVMVCAAGISQYRYRFEGHTAVLHTITYYPDFSVCAAEADIIGAINERAGGDSDFRIYISPALAGSLFENARQGLETVLSKTRLIRPSQYSYNEKFGYVQYASPEYRTYDSPGGRADTLQNFAVQLAAHTDRLEELFEIQVPEALLEELYGSNILSAGDGTLLSDLCDNCGIMRYRYGRTGSFLRLSEVQYYAGKRIVHALEQGNTEMLTAREKETLSAAQRLISGVTGSEPEREKAVHDALADRICYFTDDDDPYDENDCAVGALLNGLADCDGYADAFYLCGSLAGLEVAYQHGEAASNGKDPMQTLLKKEETHMWNLVRINGSWVMTDVTWDDEDEDRDTTYVYYNLGCDQAAVSHRWDERAVITKAVPEAGNELRGPELAQKEVNSWEELYAWLRRCADEERDRIHLRFPTQMKVKENSEKLSALVYSVGTDSFRWVLSDRAAELYQIRYYENRAVCDTREEVLAFLRQCAQRRASSVRIYCAGEALYRELYENQSRGFFDLLKQAGCKNRTISYNETYRMLMVKEAEW